MSDISIKQIGFFGWSEKSRRSGVLPSSFATDAGRDAHSA